MQNAEHDRYQHSGSRETGAGPWTRALLAYAAIASLVALPGLGSTGLIMMEGMVANTADTMLETGDVLVPRLYGELFTYKPPLVYWTTALATHLAGRSEWSLRLPSALAAIVLGLVVLLLVGRAIRPHTGLFAGLASITGFLFLQKLKIAEFDAQLAAAVGIATALACFNLAVKRPAHPILVWSGCYFALAAAFLAKGPPALMAFAPGLVLAALFTRRARRLFDRGHLVGVALFLAIVGTYFWLGWRAVGPALLEQPLLEARDRGLEWTLQSFSLTLLKPVLIFGAFLPWSLAWFWSAPERGRQSASESMLRAGWGFLIGGVLAFVAVPTLEPRYFLPLATASAIVCAIGLERMTSSSSRRALSSAAVLAILFAGAGIIVAFIPEFTATARLATASAGVAALLVVNRLRLRPGKHAVAALLLVAALCAWTIETWAFRPRRALTRDLSGVAAALSEELPTNATIWAQGAVGEIGNNASLYYYLGRPILAFRAASGLPDPDAYMILNAQDVSRLGRTRPMLPRRLELVRRVHHSRGNFMLYRVLAPRSRTAKVHSTGRPAASASRSTFPAEPETP